MWKELAKNLGQAFFKQADYLAGIEPKKDSEEVKKSSLNNIIARSITNSLQKLFGKKQQPTQPLQQQIDNALLQQNPSLQQPIMARREDEEQYLV